tara:strand:- start:480 stop:815 length:336 start_codon:yes stop_codon:yes gene_type:complete
MPGGRLGKAEDGSVIYSQTPRAIREREKRRLKLEERVLENIRSYSPKEPPELPSPGVSFSTEDIGIKTITRAAPPPETDTYTCQNCKGTLTKGDPECPVCELGPLDWTGVN